MKPESRRTAFDRRRAMSLMAAGAVSPLIASRDALAQTPPPVAGQPPHGPMPDPTETIDLWPEGAPGMPAIAPTETVLERSTDPGYSDRAVHGITRPRLAVFRAPRPNGAAVLLTPGGGYRWVVVDKEGYECARWLQARGVTCFVLFYRLPGEGWVAGPDVALHDAQRAMRLIRARARQYSLDAERIGVLGFSAGGHVAADLAARFDHASGDTLSARPCAAALLYPVVSMSAPQAHAGSRQQLLGSAPSPALEAAHSPHQLARADAPPHFLVHAEDDASVPIDNSLLLRAALRAKNVTVESHWFEKGGHGFGLRLAAGFPVAAWPELLLAWGKRVGWLGYSA